MARPNVYQITSNEPAQTIMHLVAESAKRHELAMKVSESIAFNAPFSGDEYFTQEIELSPNPRMRANASFENCIREIETIVEQELSEGFVEACWPESDLSSQSR